MPTLTIDHADLLVDRTLTECTWDFVPGAVVEHMSPELVDWRGEVVALKSGPRKGGTLHVEGDGTILVRVLMTVPGVPAPVLGWYDQGALRLAY